VDTGTVPRSGPTSWSIRHSRCAESCEPDPFDAKWIQTNGGGSPSCQGGLLWKGNRRSRARTLEVLGFEPERIYDVGVAGLHRLVKHTRAIQAANVVIVVAGMEGALASVVVNIDNGFGAAYLAASITRRIRAGVSGD